MVNNYNIIPETGLSDFASENQNEKQFFWSWFESGANAFVGGANVQHSNGSFGEEKGLENSSDLLNNGLKNALESSFFSVEVNVKAASNQKAFSTSNSESGSETPLQKGEKRKQISKARKRRRSRSKVACNSKRNWSDEISNWSEDSKISTTSGEEEEHIIVDFAKLVEQEQLSKRASFSRNLMLTEEKKLESVSRSSSKENYQQNKKIKENPPDQQLQTVVGSKVEMADEDKKNVVSSVGSGAQEVSVVRGSGSAGPRAEQAQELQTQQETILVVEENGIEQQQQQQVRNYNTKVIIYAFSIK